MHIDLDKQWWVIPAIAGAIGLAALAVAALLLPGATPYALLLLLLLVGSSFLWAFLRHDVWWAIAPAVLAFADVVAVVTDSFLPANNGWIAVLIVGAGTLIIAAIPNRRAEVNAAHFAAIAIVILGFLISPMRAVWKAGLIAASILLAAYFAWLDREDLKRLFAR